MVERASGWEPARLLGDPGARVPLEAVARCRSMLQRAAAGEPLQYVLGRWGFRGLDLRVDPRALIPRPETEHVAEVARKELARLRAGRSGRATGSAGTGEAVVDLGTGSGAIALSLAIEDPALTVWATDASPHALAVAALNRADLGAQVAGRVHLRAGDWYGALPVHLQARVALIVANPPYLAEDEVVSLHPAVANWEPREALIAGSTGLEAIQAVVAGAPRWLTRPGALVLEIAPDQAGAVALLATTAGFDEVSVRPDLAGRARALVARVRGTT